MGSSYEVKYVAATPVSEVRAMVEQELQAFDLAFSNWRTDSEIARVNAHKSTDPIPVSDRFGRVVQLALLIAVATEGAFDPTMKPISDLYKAAKKDPKTGLLDGDLFRARQRVGYSKLRMSSGTLIKQRADLELDLDGIVAGAAADAVGAMLRNAGIASFYVQITGEVLCNGVKPDGATWRIGVVDPSSSDEYGQTAIVAVPLRDRALCSSGDYRNATIVDDQVVHHLFDPRTGRNPEHSLVSASVIADSCAVADALGTALMVLGDQEGARAWPSMKDLGARSALMLLPSADSTWQEVKIEWPLQDS
jgi:FAD:protein FMN transferase